MKYFKKYILSFFAILLLIIFTINGLHARQNITIIIGSYSSTTCAVGDTIVLPITVAMASGISVGAISMAIDYYTTQLRCISGVTGLNANIATGFLSNCNLEIGLNVIGPYTASTRRQFRAAW